tara:strand:+ start:180 stop:317 length:138 start_codon:yes stop_codon:yes gene_type:complete
MTRSREEILASMRAKERQARAKAEWDRKMKKQYDLLIATRRAEGL